MAQKTRIYTVDRFLGLNEAADGDTELKMGHGARMENFRISDGYNLVSRSGIQRIDPENRREQAEILASWAGNVGGNDRLFLVDRHGGTDRIWIYTVEPDGGIALLGKQTGALGLTAAGDAKVKIFPFAGTVFIMSAAKTLLWQKDELRQAESYVPLVVAGASPAGGGTLLENLNLLTPLRRISYSSDGESTVYVLPEEAVAVTEIRVDNVLRDITEGTFDAAAHSYTFPEAPEKGVGNVEVTYTTDPVQGEENRMRVVNMTLAESYNGATDTRLFLAGDGSNICIYSGVPENGDLTKLYFPAMNEVAVDMAAGSVTGLIRSDNKLLVFTKSGADLITYEPVTLADGSTIGGFYLRTANREFGNEVMGQTRVVRNRVRTVTRGGIYEWNFGSYYTKDERHAKRVSDSVSKTFRSADAGSVVTCDDNFDQTYYVFLNDSAGTVLVNRYALEENVWCVYRSRLCRNVKNAVMVGRTMAFVTDKDCFYFAPWATMDAPEVIGGEKIPISALWESGYMDFGADFYEKYTGEIFVSMLPQSRSRLTVTAVTEKRDDYPEKIIGSEIFSFENVSFGSWSFDMRSTPRIQKVRLKVKGFVYYKLIFRVDEPGARATVLSFDQKINMISKVK